MYIIGKSEVMLAVSGPFETALEHVFAGCDLYHMALAQYRCIITECIGSSVVPDVL